MNERTVLIVRVVFLVSCTAASTAFAQSPGLEEAGDTREAGEYQYRQEALYFGEQLAVTVVGRYASVSSETVVYQGEMHRKLGDQELFALVNRPDLVEAYNTRRRYATIGIAGGTVVGVGGLIVAMVGDGMVHPRCEFGVTCEAPQAGTGRALVIGGGVIPDEDCDALRKIGVKEIMLQDTPPAEIVAMVKRIVAERGAR